MFKKSFNLLTRVFVGLMLILVGIFGLGLFYGFPAGYYNNSLLLGSWFICLSLIAYIIWRIFELLKNLHSSWFSLQGIKTVSSILIHFSILLILAGWFLSSYYTTETYQEAAEGKTIYTSQMGFPYDLQVNKLVIDYYDDGSPRQFSTYVTVIKDNIEVFSQKIAVNQPLNYQGVKVYQFRVDKVGWVTGLLIKKDPGLPWLYGGFIFLLTGLGLKAWSQKAFGEVEPC